VREQGREGKNESKKKERESKDRKKAESNLDLAVAFLSLRSNQSYLNRLNSSKLTAKVGQIS